MHTLKSARAFGSIAVVLALLSTVVPAAAVTSPILAQATAQATFNGTVHDDTGATVPNAQVTVTGPTTQTTTTDSNGNFTVNIPPGIYRVAITKGGYNQVALPDVVATAGTSTPLTVTMSQTSLNSLQTIGTVTSTAGRSSINAGPAQTTVVSGQAFQDLGDPQVNSVLQRIPGLTVQQMGSQQDRTIVVGGVQPYETQVLIDGHPLAQGQYGVWVSTYFPSFLIGSAEVQSGPGNTTPFANLAVGGTANLVTPGFTKQTHISLTQGGDNYGSQWTTFLGTGSIGHLGYVVDVGTLGQNTPLTGTQKCITLPDANNPGFSVVGSCGSADGNFYQRGEVFKLRYDFTPETSLTTSFVGAFGGFSPQGTAWGTAQGPTEIENCEVGTPAICGVPGNPYIGRVINGYAWYTGSAIYNNQTMWDAELRTAIGSGTLLVRPYVGQIEPEIIVNNNNQDNISFYGAPGVFAPGLVPGQPPPAGYTPPAGSTEADCEAAFSSITNPSGIYSVTSTNQFECYANPYTTYEQDKLYGMTTSFTQPLGGDDFLELTYDYHGQSTFAYIDQPAFVSVPFSTDRYSTFALTGSFAVAPLTTFNLGLYNTQWSVDGSEPASNTNPTLVGFSRAISHFDPHGAFVIRPDAADSIRVAAGTSTTFPFVGQVSGLATYEPPACSLGAPYADGGTLTEKNPNLNPETSIAYDVGADHRFSNGSVLSLDLQNTVVHGVFEELTSSVPSTNPNLCLSTPALEGIYYPANVARLVAKSANLKYTYAPQKGFGFNLAVSAESSIISGFNAADAPTLPANNIQVCGPGTTVGASTCIPYLQGYGQLTWTQPNVAFLALGVQYYGMNNAFFSPPFAQVDFVARRDVTKNVSLQVSVQNLLNTNNYGLYLPIPNAGVPLITNNVVGNTIQQGSFATSLVPASPRYLRLDLLIHI
jgi:outer membrane receptor protein involved in Fe transport